jgi:hypothetical protein
VRCLKNIQFFVSCFCSKFICDEAKHHAICYRHGNENCVLCKYSYVFIPWHELTKMKHASSLNIFSPYIICLEFIYFTKDIIPTKFSESNSSITSYNNEFLRYVTFMFRLQKCFRCSITHHFHLNIAFIISLTNKKMFLRNVGYNSTDYTASYPRRWYSSNKKMFCLRRYSAWRVTSL